MMQLPPDPYKILGIAADATLADIRAAHRKLVKQCHPDKVSAEASDDEKRAKEDEFKRVQKAYELLADDTARANYDEKVKMHKRFMTAKRMATATAAFTSSQRPENWAGPTVNVHVRTAEPRPDTFSSRSPPKEAPRQYHRVSREFEEQQRANIKVERDAQPKPRRGASYDAHPSPTEDVARSREEALERELEETRRQLEREKEKAARAGTSDREKEKKPSKTDKSRSEKSRKEEKSSRSSKKDKDVYVEDPDENYKNGKSKSSGKSTHKPSHRSPRHRERSSSRSVSRTRLPTKKTSRDKAHLRPEVEEPDDTESDIPHDEKFRNNYATALEYQRQAGSRRSKDSPDLRRAYTDSTLPQVPSAPTPPPMQNPAGPKPTVIDVNPSSRPPAQAGSPPGGFSSPPRTGVLRSHTTPHQSAYTTRTVNIGPDMETYYGSPSGRGRSRSRLNQGYYPEDDEVDMSGGQRSRRGSSNTYHTAGYTADNGGSSRMYTVRENPVYYDNSGAAYYPSSGHSPKGYTVPIPIHNGPPSGARVVPVVPFGKMSTAKSYTYDDVAYGSVPHTSEDYPGYVHA